MKKKEIMSRLFNSGKSSANKNLLDEINKIWEDNSHILHVGFRNNPDGIGQKLIFGFTNEPNVELAQADSLNFPIDDTLQVRYTRTENIIKAPNNQVVVARYANMYRDELQEVVNILAEALNNQSGKLAEYIKKEEDAKLLDIVNIVESKNKAGI